MKNLLRNLAFLLTMSVTLSFLASCSEDDEGDNVGSSEDLIGTWNVSALDFEFTINGEDFIQWLVDNAGLSNDDAEFFRDLFETAFSEDITGSFNFNADGTYTATDGGTTYETGTWSLDGNLLTLNVDGDDEPVTLTVNTLTSSALVLSLEETQTEDFDEDGATEEIRIAIQITLAK